MIEVPEHLLQRSRDRRRALGLPVDDDGTDTAPAAASAAPAAASAPAAAAKAPVPTPAGAPPEPPKPESPWVSAAKSRKKVPMWAMPVLLFLPIWLVMYVGTLEEPTREEGVLYEGSHVYTEAGCAGCHGATGGGGTGPAFGGGAVVETFPDFESHIEWIVHGTQGFADAGLNAYGANGKGLASYNGSNMPAFGDDLTATEIVEVVFYERIELGAHEDELELAEAVYDRIEHGEIEMPEHFDEGAEGAWLAQITELFAETRAELGGEETAAGE